LEVSMNSDRPPHWRRKILYEDISGETRIISTIATLGGMYMWQGAWAALAAFGFLAAVFGAAETIVAAVIGERR
jgi:hypothetical protein